MPRVARLVIPGQLHHAVQRGNNGQQVFHCDEDYMHYLGLLAEEAHRHEMSVQGWCLMPDHVHLVVRPARAPDLAAAIGRIHFRYAQYANRARGRGGNLWHDRFRSCLLEGGHVLEAIHAIERNPVRARLVRLPWLWSWSSAAAHLGELDFYGLLDNQGWLRLVGGLDWRERLRQREDPKTLARLLQATSTGRPLADAPYLAELEAQLGRRLHALPNGRPRKHKAPACD